MKTVLIVDDEKPSRELLKMSCNWIRNGFGEVLEARNGQEALEVYRQRHPFIVITDIQMPVMDGLDFIREIRKIDSKQRILVLSCHEDFQFAREALQLGVLDYILKDSYTERSLQQTMDRVLREGAHEQNKAHARSNPLRLLVDGNAADHEIQSLFQVIHKGVQACFLCAGRLTDIRIATDLVEPLLQRLYQMLDAHNGGDVYMLKDTLYVLVCLSDTVSLSRRESLRFSLSDELHRLIEECFGAKAVMGVSRVCSNNRQLGTALWQAKHAPSSSIFTGDRSVIYADYLSQEESDSQRINELLKYIQQALQSSEQISLQQTLDTLYREVKERKCLELLQHVNAMLMSILTQACTANALPFQDVFEAEKISLNVLDNMNTIEEMSEWFHQRFKALGEAISPSHSPRIKRIVSYIDHHCQEDMSLENVADRFQIHKVYLAKIFKEEIGESVNEYIRKVRMEQAKRLLEKPHSQVSTVYKEMGFNNPQTFYNLFKKHTGMSPSEYKTMCELRHSAE